MQAITERSIRRRPQQYQIVGAICRQGQPSLADSRQRLGQFAESE